MKKRHLVANGLMLASLILPAFAEVKVAADSFYDNQTNAQRADIINWVASTPEQISQNLSVQRIDKTDLNGQRYVIQWGDTLWGISQATGISVEKLAYDNHIANIDLIYAGDVLILNRDGSVPVDYSYQGNGREVAKSQVTINNYVDNSSTVVIVNNTSFYDETTINHNYPASDAPEDAAKSYAESAATDSTLQAASEEDTDQTAASSSQARARKSTETSTAQESMDKEDFTDAVQDAINDLLQDGGGDEIEFVDQDEREQLDSDATMTSDKIYKTDAPLEGKFDQYTEETAKKLAEAIYKDLTANSQLVTLETASKVRLNLEVDGSKVKYNMTTYDEEATTESTSNDSSFDDADDQDSSDTESTDASSNQDQEPVDDEDDYGVQD